jgi:hypothetical protein
MHLKNLKERARLTSSCISNITEIRQLELFIIDHTITILIHFPVSNYYVNGSGSGPSPDPYGEGQGQAELKRRGSMDAMDLYWYRDRSDNLFLL